jgi:nicotinate-nucleotide adenylyltransferase
MEHQLEKKTKIGLLFGSFNPIHIGHLFVGEMAIESGHVDLVVYVVSPESPYKTGTGTLAPAEDRLAMVHRATEYNKKFIVSDMEFHLEKPSFTYRTIKEFKKLNPGIEYYFICGTDVYVDIPNWEGGKEVVENANFLVYPRNTTTNYTPDEMKDKTKFLNGVPNLEISATFLRDQIKKGNTTKHLLPDPVQKYITENSLYK